MRKDYEKRSEVTELEIDNYFNEWLIIIIIIMEHNYCFE
jgi:hypothetical protein